MRVKIDLNKIFKYSLLLLGVIILGIFIFTIHPQEIINSFKSLSSPIATVLTAFSITSISITLKSYRWSMLIHKIANIKTSLLFSGKAVLAGIAAGSLIPGRLELARPLIYKNKYDIPLSKSLSALIIERAIDLLCFVIFLMLGLLFIPSQDIISLKIVIVILSFIILCILAAIFLPTYIQKIISKITLTLPLPTTLKEKITKFTEQILHSFTIFQSKKTVVYIAILSLLMNTLELGHFYVIANAFGIELTLPILAIILSGGILLGVISAIPGGIGVTEFSNVTLLTTLVPGILATTAKSVILLDRVISYYIVLFVGAIFLIQMGYFTKVKQISKEQPTESQTEPTSDKS